jgi:hypothetical protein
MLSSAGYLGARGCSIAESFIQTVCHSEINMMAMVTPFETTPFKACRSVARFHRCDGVEGMRSLGRVVDVISFVNKGI